MYSHEAPAAFEFPPYNTLPDITQPGWDCDPFRMVRLGDRGQVLYFVAVNHAAIPDDHNPHYNFVRLGIGEFEVLTWDLERYLVVEGGLRTPGESEAISYWTGGEGGMAAYYAGKWGYKQRCFEPEDDGVQHLRNQGFSEDVISTLLFSRLVPSWRRRFVTYNAVKDHLRFASAATEKDQPSFEAFAKSRIEGTGSIASSLADRGYSYDDYVRIYEAQYNTTFKPNWQTAQFLKKETVGYMLPPRSPVHEAAIAVNGLRDRMLATGIRDLWETGASMFVPFGYTHGLTLKSFIETLGYDLDECLE